jgi:phenylacetic acid degradation operon negative regulatory protein
MTTAPRTPPKPRALFLDVYGPFVRPLGGWIAIADLVALMGELGVDADIVRSTASRMTKDGMLERCQGPAGAQGYALSVKLRRALELGDRRIFEAQRPARLSDGWVVVTFSIPESDRQLRHQLRSRLVWLGFGNLAPGVWLAPRRLLPDAMAVVAHFSLEPYVDFFSAHYEGLDTPHALASRAWDLRELSEMYSEFLAGHQATLARWRTPPRDDEGRLAFVDYVCTLTQWRRLPFLDPGLPAELLPDGWPGHEASRSFLRLARTLGPRAFDYVRQVMGLPDEGKQLARLHGG